jgi:hypothetical protein
MSSVAKRADAIGIGTPVKPKRTESRKFSESFSTGRVTHGNPTGTRRLTMPLFYVSERRQFSGEIFEIVDILELVEATTETKRMPAATPKRTKATKRFVNNEPVGGWPKTGLATSREAMAFLAIRRTKFSEALAQGFLVKVAHPLFPGNWFDWEDLWKISKSR